MKAGDVVGGYTLLEDFRVVGAGLSEWTFASRDGREYFLKRFLSPTYPDDDAPGSDATKARKRARCAAFEAHHRGIKAALAPITSYGGNLVATLDFFRDGAKYYKVTEKIDVAGFSTADIARLDLPAKLVLLKTVTHSLKILHDLSIVHSDLKPSNVLVKRTERGYTTKLIDFDSSYLVGSPPPPEEIVGTLNYYSPELVRYVQGAGAGEDLTTASDIFALGLIFAEYLTGSLPTFDPASHEAAVAVLGGAVLIVAPDGLPDTLRDLVQQMLLLDSAARPSVGEVHSTLLGLGSGTTVARALRPPAPGATAPSLLRGRGLRLAGRGVRSRAVEEKGPAPPPTAAAVPTVAADPRPAAPGLTERAVDTAASDSAGDGLPALVGRLLGRIERRRR